MVLIEEMVLGGSVAGDYLGESVASPLVSMIDFANNVDDEICPVPVFVDDEGTKSEDVTIIEDGVLKILCIIKIVLFGYFKFTMEMHVLHFQMNFTLAVWQTLQLCQVIVS